MVDALVSGTSIRKDVQVRVLFWAQIDKTPGLKPGVTDAGSADISSPGLEAGGSRITNLVIPIR